MSWQVSPCPRQQWWATLSRLEMSPIPSCPYWNLTLVLCILLLADSNKSHPRCESLYTSTPKKVYDTYLNINQCDRKIRINSQTMELSIQMNQAIDFSRQAYWNPRKKRLANWKTVVQADVSKSAVFSLTLLKLSYI